MESLERIEHQDYYAWNLSNSNSVDLFTTKKRHLTNALMRCKDSISTEISVFKGQGYSNFFTAPQNHRTSTFYAMLHPHYLQLRRSAQLETVGWDFDWRIEAWFYGDTRLLIPQKLNKIRSIWKFWNVSVPT